MTVPDGPLSSFGHLGDPSRQLLQYDNTRTAPFLSKPLRLGGEYAGFWSSAPIDKDVRLAPSPTFRHPLASAPLGPGVADRVRPAAADRLEPVALTRPRPALSKPGPWERFTAGRPLLVILLGQLVLSLHLLWANTAYPDEALYLMSGHLEWSHWLHGASIPRFQTYFPGAPVIYPPIGAAADALGGLAAARALSLCFMLGATSALHGVTKRIFGRTPATFAAALFAGVGATQYLGAFATYDALALALLALATWLGVRAVTAMRCQFTLAVLAGLVLVLADVTKYAATLFDPVVILVAVLFAWQRRGRRDAFGTGLIMFGAVAWGGAGALAAGGVGYWQGVTLTTLTWTPNNSSSAAIFLLSLEWASAVAILAVIGAIRCTFKGRCYGALGLTLALAVWLAPAEQARIYTFTSLFKNVGFGEWFGAIAAGVALASITAAVPRIKAEGALRASWAVVLTSTVFGFFFAVNQFSSWPNASGLVSVLRPLLKGDQHSILATYNGNILGYYLRRGEPDASVYFIDSQGQWQNNFNGSSFHYKNPLTGSTVTGLGAYYLAVKNGYFSAITLSNNSSWPSINETISHYIKMDNKYRLVESVSYVAAGKTNIYQVWVHGGAR